VSLPLALSPAAEDDLPDAAAWYDDQQPGLGDAFLRSLDACFARVERLPRGFPADANQIRSVLLRRFPYVVLFRVGGRSGSR
jgi:plasmid stabilization system protein ParE